MRRRILKFMSRAFFDRIKREDISSDEVLLSIVKMFFV